eukprot:tig00020903_g15102.t1
MIRKGRLKYDPNLYQRVANFMKAGVEAPAWYKAAERNPPDAIRPRAPKPPIITFPYDKLIAEYQRKHALGTTRQEEAFRFLDEAPPARMQLFVTRQMELMESGLGEKEAYRKTELEFLKEDWQLQVEVEVASGQSMEFGGLRGKTAAEQIQEQEELALARGNLSREEVLARLRSLREVRKVEVEDDEVPAAPAK